MEVKRMMVLSSKMTPLFIAFIASLLFVTTLFQGSDALVLKGRTEVHDTTAKKQAADGALSAGKATKNTGVSNLKNTKTGQREQLQHAIAKAKEDNDKWFKSPIRKHRMEASEAKANVHFAYAKNHSVNNRPIRAAWSTVRGYNESTRFGVGNSWTFGGIAFVCVVGGVAVLVILSLLGMVQMPWQ